MCSRVNTRLCISAIWEPVCGCDGVTYSNSAEAACNNIFEYTEGDCLTVNDGCWEDGELYCVGCELFIDECNTRMSGFRRIFV